MALYNNSYSGIITQGLGGSACYSILTYQFGVFAIEIGPTPPPANIGGGGPYPTAAIHQPVNWHTPKTNAWKYQPRQVNIKVKLGEQEWSRQYVLSYGKARAVIAVSKVISNVVKKVSAVVSNIRTRMRRGSVGKNDK